MDLLPWLGGEKDLPTAMKAYERFWVHQALVANTGITKAAQALGISHQELRWILDHRHSDLSYLSPKKKRKRT
jgi:hypothetical protein